MREVAIRGGWYEAPEADPCGEIQLADLLLECHFLEQGSRAAGSVSAHDRGLSGSDGGGKKRRANRDL